MAREQVKTNWSGCERSFVSVMRAGGFQSSRESLVRRLRL